jgi:hypothetical protein
VPGPCYGASITKTVFASLVTQLADEGRIDLDASIAKYLDKPLPDSADERRYSTWSHLSGDDRWKAITPRVLLTHSAGFANFGFLEPDGMLRIHFAPGSRYAYSGEGIILMQVVLERGLGLDGRRHRGTARRAQHRARGELLSPRALTEMTAPHLPITTRSQFPTVGLTSGS